MRHGGYNEEFHSTNLGAKTEALELFIAGSGFRNHIETSAKTIVLDVGLGLGYNALATIHAWLETPGAGGLRIISLEQHNELVEGLQRGGGAWIADDVGFFKVAQNLEHQDDGLFRGLISHPDGSSCEWLVVVGDALASDWQRLAQGMSFIWQDAFSPQKNPEMWTSDWFTKVGESCQRDAILMTYSVARPVRESLQTAGFQVEKIPAMGAKRQWLRATWQGLAGEMQDAE